MAAGSKEEEGPVRSVKKAHSSHSSSRESASGRSFGEGHVERRGKARRNGRRVYEAGWTRSRRWQ